jgi:glucosamine--fructose-6-phosphate aminotransferase (isomerizing)
MGAGVEGAVATRTFLAAAVLLQLLADALAGVPAAQDALDGLAAALDELSADDAAARAAADRFADVRSLELVGRGATLGIAHYGALTIKETAAFPAEALSGGAFRHGPLELVDAPAGAVVLVPPGPTAKLSIRLAQETAAAGWPTWAIGAAAVVHELGTDRGAAGLGGRLVVTGVPVLDGPLAAVPLIVPLQQLAAVLAERRGRVPGLLLRGSKVTETQ